MPVFTTLLNKAISPQLLEPLYKACLHIKPQSKFSLMQYFWSLASKVFLSTVMVTCLLLYYSILLNLSTNQALVVGHSVTFYLAATTLILTTFALPYGFLVQYNTYFVHVYVASKIWPQVKSPFNLLRLAHPNVNTKAVTPNTKIT